MTDEFLTSLELFHSLADAVGLPVPDDLIVDGHDWWPTLRGETDSPRKTMFWKRRDLLGARVGDWKWVDMGGKSGGLFNLKDDIAEKKDLSQSNPKKLAEMKVAFQAWLKKMEEAEPRGPFRDF